MGRLSPCLNVSSVSLDTLLWNLLMMLGEMFVWLSRIRICVASVDRLGGSLFKLENAVVLTLVVATTVCVDRVWVGVVARVRVIVRVRGVVASTRGV